MGIYPGGKVRCMMRKIIISGIILCLLLSGCKMPKQEERKINLVLAAFEQNAELDKQVALFNQENVAYYIEVRQYNRYEEGDGIQRLQREIVSGEGPDIINFGSEYMLFPIKKNCMHYPLLLPCRHMWHGPKQWERERTGA